MLSNADGSVLVRLVTPKLLIDPRVSVSREPQATLWFPLFDCPNQALDAVLTGIGKVFFVLDDLAHFSNKCVVVADHSIKALIGMDAGRPSTMQEYHLIERQSTLRSLR